MRIKLAGSDFIKEARELWVSLRLGNQTFTYFIFNPRDQLFASTRCPTTLKLAEFAGRLMVLLDKERQEAKAAESKLSSNLAKVTQM